MTVAEAAERYDTDAAGVWDMVAAGFLIATRKDDETWEITEEE